MKDILVIGLGNPLMGDDGIGRRAAEALAADPEIAERAGILCCGTDLLRFADQMLGRRGVILIDAIQDGRPPGSVSVFEGTEIESLDGGPQHAHWLPLTEAIPVLRALPAYRGLRFTLIAVSVDSIRAGEGVSEAVQRSIPHVAALVKQALASMTMGPVRQAPSPAPDPRSGCPVAATGRRGRRPQVRGPAPRL